MHRPIGFCWSLMTFLAIATVSSANAAPKAFNCTFSADDVVKTQCSFPNEKNQCPSVPFQFESKVYGMCGTLIDDYMCIFSSDPNWSSEKTAKLAAKKLSKASRYLSVALFPTPASSFELLYRQRANQPIYSIACEPK